MKRIFIIVFTALFVNISIGQISKKKTPIFYSECMPSKLEFVSFCGVTFKVPRSKEAGPSCCHGDSSQFSTNLSCNNGGMVSWSYYPNSKTAKSKFEEMINGYFTNKDILQVQKEPITCYLLNKKVKGYKLKLKLKSVTTTTGSNKRIENIAYWYLINAYGVVNGQPVIVELHSNKLYEIIKPISQIIHL